MIYLKTFKLECGKKRNVYPFNVFNDRDSSVFVFDKITILYGNNGCGKSTILNIIANKLGLKGKELGCPNGKIDYFGEYLLGLEYQLGEDEYGNEINKIPPNSRYIKSEDILYEVKKVQQSSILRKSLELNFSKKMGNGKKFLMTKEGQEQFARFKFAQEKYSNGETTLQILEDCIEPDTLCLLDEPEISLSLQNQVKLGEKINEISRYLGVQFIIATHSPFLLGTLDAKIFNLDTSDYRVQKWYELPNIKYLYEFLTRSGKFL